MNLGKLICVFRAHTWLQITSQTNGGDKHLHELVCTTCNESWSEWRAK